MGKVVMAITVLALGVFLVFLGKYGEKRGYTGSKLFSVGGTASIGAGMVMLLIAVKGV